ncbi:MAG: sensor histidine kinase [Bradyrhizobium sp.]|nr:sensor histidine kinase [Bradyrhizobium sp.]
MRVSFPLDTSGRKRQERENIRFSLLTPLVPLSWRTQRLLPDDGLQHGRSVPDYPTAEEIVVTVFTCDPPALQGSVLLRELHQRVAGGLASAINLVSAAAIGAEGAEAKHALSEVVELLHGYADVHRTLEMPRAEMLIHAESYIHELGYGMRRALLDRMNIQLTFATRSLVLQPERCWQLGLIVHELVMIAAEHACFEARAGQIEVRLTRNGAMANCVIADNGWRSVRNVSDREFRTTKNLVRALGGSIERAFGKDFTSMILSFPLTERERAVNWTIAARQMKPRRCTAAIVSNDTTLAARAAVSRGRAVANEPDQKPPRRRQGQLAVSCRSVNVLGELSSPSHHMDAP